jgi:hypothetical protein
MKTICTLLGVALAALFLHPLSAGLPAAPQFILAVETGQAAPFPGGPATFSVVSNPVINVRGDIVFRAQIAGASVTAANNEGLYLRNSAGVLSRIVGESDTIPDVNLPLFVLGAQHTLLNDGTVLFLGTFGGAATAANNGALLQATPGQPIKTLAREGQPIGETGFNLGPSAFEPGSGVPPHPPFAVGDLDGDGESDLITFLNPPTVVASAGGQPQTALIYITNGVVQLGPKEGDAVPGLDGQFFGDLGFAFNVGGISVNNGITFLGSSNFGQTLGIFQQRLDGSLLPLVLSGDKATPFGKGFLFGGFSPPTVGSDGSVIFDATADKPPGGSGPPQFRNGLFTLKNGKPSLIAGRDRGAPGIPGQVVYSGFGQTENIGTNRGYLTAFYADLFNRKEPSDPLAEALYIRDGTPKLIAREGGPAPGAGPGVTVKEHDSLTSDDFVNLYWIALLLDDDEEFEAVFDSFLAGKKPNTNILLRVPSIVDFGAGGTRTVTDILPFPTVARGSGAPMIASPAGLVLTCNFKDGTSGLLFCPKQDPPIFQPDIIVQEGQTFTGFGIYPDDAKQRIPLNIPVGVPGKDITIIITNDGNVPDDIKLTTKIPKLRGPAGIGDYRGLAVNEDPNGMRARDLYDGTGITVNLQPGASYTETVHILYPSNFDGYKSKDERKVEWKLRVQSLGDPEKDDNFKIFITIPE